MTSLNIKKYDSSSECELYGGYELNRLLEDCNMEPVLLMVSAGSAFALLDGVNMENVSENLTVSVLDERFSTDSKINNFLQLQQTQFYKQALDAGTNFIGTLPRPGETKEQMASRWEKTLRAWRDENPDGKIIVTLGMGTDGHTAGIMPFPEDAMKFSQLFKSKNWITAYDAQNKNPHALRVTTTITFFPQIDNAVALVCGEQKKLKLKELATGAFNVNVLPAQVWNKIKNVVLLTDQG
jgi:6-phosphogluconolactonase/glucosamine-6-phosphate isomerase/deaminase